MNATHFFPAVLIVLYLGAGAVYGVYGDWWRVLYWTSAACITVAVTMMGKP
jgi:hypothetical protein